jgi:hypothetical protein
MLKTLITPQESAYSLSIPSHYIGKKLEVLLYAVEELSENRKTNRKQPSDFFGTLSIQEGEEFQKYIADSRLEWDRNI